MIINHNHNFIFISIPKTASTSIMSVLDPESVHQKPEIYHQTLGELIKIEPDLENYLVIAVFRSPFERLASTYYDAIKDENHVTLKSLRTYNDFNAFVRDLPNSKYYKTLRHLWPQYIFIQSNHKSIAKKNFYYENFQDIKTYIYTFLENKNVEFPHHRRTSENRPESYKIYSFKSLIIVLQIYKKDFLQNPRYFFSFINIALKILNYKFQSFKKLKFKLVRNKFIANSE